MEGVKAFLGIKRSTMSVDENPIKIKDSVKV